MNSTLNSFSLECNKKPKYIKINDPATFRHHGDIDNLFNARTMHTKQ